jgi:predicted PurR-regulated permease PerM
MVTEKRKNFLINFTYFAVIVVMALLFLLYVAPLASPFIIGFFIAWVLQKPIRFLRRKLSIPDKMTAILAVLLFYATIGVLISLASVKAFSEIGSLIAMVPTFYSVHVQPLLWDVLTGMEIAFLDMDPSLAATLEDLTRQFLQSLGERVTGWSMAAMGIISSIASSLPALFIKIVLMIISTFFIAVDYERLTGFCMRQLSDKGKTCFCRLRNIW